MAFTYNPAAPVDRDKVRGLIGDTNSADAVFDDAEIAMFLAIEGEVKRSAAAAAYAGAAKLSRQVDTKAGSVSVKLSQRAEAMTVIGDTLAKQAGGFAPAVTPFAGGLSVAAKDTQEADTDRVQPAFTRTMFDNPGTQTPEKRV